MKVSVEKEWGVVEDLARVERKDLCERLNTETEIVGDRLKFKPSVNSILMLRDEGAEFDDICRATWAYLFKQHEKEIEFKFKTEPYDHQRKVWEEIKNKKYFALFWEMGLGKTKTALDVAVWKYSKHVIDAILVITLNGVHRNWINKEIPVHLAVDDYTTAFWNLNRVESGMRGICECKNFAIATINFDSVHTKKGNAFCLRFLTTRRVLLIIDESHCIVTPSAQRTKAILKLGRLAKARLIMTGTPIANSPLDLWTQFNFLAPKILHSKSFYGFRRRFAIMQNLLGPGGKAILDGRGKVVQEVVGYKDIAKLRKLISPHNSRLTKDDCLDLPPKTYRTHGFELPKEYRVAYNKMKRDLIIELEDDRRVTAQLALTKLLRLQQLCCGFVVPDDADKINTDILGEPFSSVNPRITALNDVLKKVHNKAIVWSTHRYSITEIEKNIKSIYGEKSILTYFGDTSEDDREIAENRFQDPDDEVRFLVSNPATGGTGINLTAAKDVIYYNNSFSLIMRKQSEDRAHRIGQTGTVTYTDIEAVDTVDAKIIEALLKKHDIATEMTGDMAIEWLSTAN